MNRYPVLLAILFLGAVFSTPARATAVLPMKVMVEAGDTAEFSPLFREAVDTAISRIVPAVVSGPSRGTLTVIPDRRSYWMARPSPLPRKRVPVSWLRYVPDAGFTGIDSFTYNVSDGTGGTNTASCIVRVHPPEPGNMTVLMIVNETLYPLLTPEINRLRDDIAGDGYSVRLLTWPSVTLTNDSAALRALWDTLRVEYDRTDRMLAGAILIGRMPFTWSYQGDYSGDEPFFNMSIWYRQFYYADRMYLQYADSGTALTRDDTSWVGYTSYPGYQGHSLRHIWVCRFNAEYPRGSAGPDYGDQATLIRRSLNANHDYRTGASRYPHKTFLWTTNSTFTDTALRRIWPEGERLPNSGMVVRAPGDTLNKIFTSYQAGAAGELWDVASHMNLDFINPTPMWLRVTCDTLMDRPFQQRFVLLNGCHVAAPGKLVNQHLYTRGGGCVLAVGSVDYMHGATLFSLADAGRSKVKIRRLLSSGARWGRSWLNAGMGTCNQYWHGDFTLKIMMSPSNRVPVVDTLRKSFPAAGRVRLSAAARDDDGTITAYEWWFSKPYNFGKNEPDTVTAVPAIEIDLARCTTHVRLEAIDNYKARFFVTLNRDSLVVVPSPVKGERAPGAPLPRVSVFPNPFNPAATIAFRATRPGVAVLRVFNTAGRQVGFQTLTVSGAGGYTMRWEALDSRGKRLPSGLYGFALEADNRRFYRTMALVK